MTAGGWKMLSREETTDYKELHLQLKELSDELKNGYNIPSYKPLQYIVNEAVEEVEEALRVSEKLRKAPSGRSKGYENEKK
jgi:hypothetical protein